MRENQGVKPASRAEEGNGFLGSRPICGNVGLIPAAEFESVGMGLVKEHEQNLFASHSTFPLRASQGSPGLLAPFRLGRAWQKGRIAIEEESQSPYAMY